MALDQVRGLEWLDHNEVRNYPLHSSATRIATSHGQELPNGVLVDASLSVPYTFADSPAEFYISRISRGRDAVEISIAHPVVGVVAVVQVSLTDHRQGDYYAFYGTAAMPSLRGALGLGAVDHIQKLPPGVHDFEVTATRLELGVVRLGLRAIDSIVLDNAGQRSVPISGRVILKSDQGVRFQLSQSGSTTTVAVNGTGENLRETCPCVNEEDPPIRRVNGIANDTIAIYGSACTDITVEGNGIKIDNPCSEPCCGCAETEMLQSQHRQLVAQVAALELISNMLLGNTSQLNASCALGQPAGCDSGGGENGGGELPYRW